MRLPAPPFPIRAEHVAALAALVLYAALLLPAPIIGVADNGDFARVMAAGGLEYQDRAEPWADRYFRYAHSKYGYARFGLGGYASSQLPLLFAAGAISRLCDGKFDIRLLSAFYAVFHASALYLTVKYGKTRSQLVNGFLACALSLVYLDIGYLAYFNSLFGEPFALIFFLLTAALALAVARSEGGSARLLALFYASAAALACTKLQNAPIGLAFAVLGLRFRKLSPAGAWRKTAAGGAAALVLLSLLMYAAAPQSLKQINLYQTVFYGVLKDSPAPREDLRSLGLTEELAVLAGTNYFQKGTPIAQSDLRLRRDIYGAISHMDILRFYASHPARLGQKLERTAASGMSIRPYYLGNYEKSAGKPPGALSYRFSAWSEFKRHVLPHRLAFVALVFAGYLSLAACSLLRSADPGRRRAAEVHAWIAAAGAFSFIVPILGDGEADLGKHLFLFNVCFDWMLVFACAFLLELLATCFRKPARA